MRACPDVNVLSMPRIQHPRAEIPREFLRVSMSTGLLLLPDVASSFCRIVTNPRIFQTPSSMAQARSVIDALLARLGPKAVRVL